MEGIPVLTSTLCSSEFNFQPAAIITTPFYSVLAKGYINWDSA